MKLWINENKFIDLNDKEVLTLEQAPRTRSIDWMGYYGYLPDPDLILNKLGQDMSIYRQLLSDAHVWSCYESRTAGTLSQKWKIDLPAEGGYARPNKQAYDLVQQVMKRLDVRQITEDMLQAIFFGMSPIEVMWQKSSVWLPGRVEGKPPEWFRFSESNNLRFMSCDNMITGEPVGEYKFLLPRHHASYQNPYGERVLSRCFWPIAFKKGGFKFWAIFTEKYGMPHLVGKVPRGTGETERAALLSRLVSMVQDAVAVINDDESIDMNESPSKASSAAIYEKLIEAGNKECSKAILGQTGTTEGTPGRLGNDTSMMEVRQDLIDGDKQMVCSTYNQLFAWIAELNVAGAAAPDFSYIEKEDVQKDRAERDKTLSDQGVKFTKKYYSRTYNLEEDDFDLSPSKPGTDAGPEAAHEFADTGEDPTPDILADIITNRMGEHSMAASDAIMAAVKRLLDKSGTLEEFRDSLLDLYGGIDPSDLGAIMERAMLIADLSGRYEVKNGS